MSWRTPAVCPGHDFLWWRSRHAKRVAKPRGIFKLTCIPTLLAAPLPKQYNTPTQFPPAAQAKSVVKSTTVKASTLTWFLHRKTTSISHRTTADSGIKQNRKDFISYLVHLQRRFPMHLPLCLPACRRLLFPLLHAMRESRRCAHYDCDALWIQNFQDGGEGGEISQVICFIFQ